MMTISINARLKIKEKNLKMGKGKKMQRKSISLKPSRFRDFKMLNDTTTFGYSPFRGNASKGAFRRIFTVAFDR